MFGAKTIGALRRLPAHVVEMVMVHAKRSVLPLNHDAATSRERSYLEGQKPSSDPKAHGFLCWRRSLLWVAAWLIVPVLVLRVLTLLDVWPVVPWAYRVIIIIAVVAEVGFGLGLWLAALNWSRWRRSRNFLLGSWLAYLSISILTNFFPFRVFASGLGATPETEIVFGMVFAVAVAIDLIPKVLSLLPGAIRASIATKLIAPEATAPGWLLLVAAPMLALLMLVVLLIPYQLTVNIFFLFAIAAFSGATFVQVMLGVKYCRPMNRSNANNLTKRFQMLFRGLNLLGFVLLGLGAKDLITQLPSVFQVRQLVTAGLAFLMNVVVITAIGTDLFLIGIERAERLTRSGTAPAGQDRVAAIVRNREEERSP